MMKVEGQDKEYMNNKIDKKLMFFQFSRYISEFNLICIELVGTTFCFPETFLVHYSSETVAVKYDLLFLTH